MDNVQLFQVTEREGSILEIKFKWKYQNFMKLLSQY